MKLKEFGPWGRVPGAPTLDLPMAFLTITILHYKELRSQCLDFTQG